MQFVRNRDDADEIVNDSFVAVWEKRESINLDLTIRPYLYKAVRNKSINFLNKKRVQIQDIEGLENMPNAHQFDPYELKYSKETEKIIVEIVDKLPLRCKQVFLLSRKEGFSHKEISEIMEISPKTIENQISIAIKVIKEGLEKRNAKAKPNKNDLPLSVLIALALENIS